jgi:predicted nuclease of predicted toxin-antitoxin system
VRILLDECIDEGLRYAFTGQLCQTCRYAGLKGLSNGRLLSAAEEAGFDVLITVDQNMEYQQSLRGRTISPMILQARTTNLEDLQVLVREVLKALETLKPGEVVRIGTGAPG